MNLWTVPLRLSLTLLAYVAFGLLSSLIEWQARPPDIRVLHMAALLAFGFGALAIWCWGLGRDGEGER